MGSFTTGLLGAGSPGDCQRCQARAQVTAPKNKNGTASGKEFFSGLSRDQNRDLNFSAQNDNLAANWNARGPPVPKIWLTRSLGWPNVNDCTWPVATSEFNVPL